MVFKLNVVNLSETYLTAVGFRQCLELPIKALHD